MTEFEKVLQECLLALDFGEVTVEECLARYPAHTRQLEPILLTSLYLESGREARPSAAFKARVRSRVRQGMLTHPRIPVRKGFVFFRLTAHLAMIMFSLLAAGTAYAQTALPGTAFYPWKLASETAWRAVSLDSTGTDLALAERRARELIAVADDPVQKDKALEAYLDIVDRLKSETTINNEERVYQALAVQIEELMRSGIFIPPLDGSIPQSPNEPAANSTQAPTIVPKVPELIPTLNAPVPTSAETREIENENPILPAVDVPTPQIPSLLP